MPRPRAGLAVPAGDRGTIRARQLAPLVALPVADSLALVAAGVASPDGPSAALYALAVLVGLSAAGLHRLRICLRVSDQICAHPGRGTALPVLAPAADAAGARARPRLALCVGRPGADLPLVAVRRLLAPRTAGAADRAPRWSSAPARSGRYLGRVDPRAS